MIFLDISLDDFFKQYPSLNEMAKEYSKKYKFIITNLKPYKSQDFIGLYGELSDGTGFTLNLLQNKSPIKFATTEAFDKLLQ